MQYIVTDNKTVGIILYGIPSQYMEFYWIVTSINKLCHENIFTHKRGRKSFYNFCQTVKQL